jgi:CsoR family transcriptional regulator, copper-sensing transcriptional repressor
MDRRAPQHSPSKQKITARLKSLEGHLRGVVEMVEKDTYCIDVLRQTKAIHAALKSVETMLLDRHVAHCVTEAIASPKKSERERVVRELVDVLDGSKR